MPILEQIDDAAAPQSAAEAEAEGGPRLALVDPSRLRRDCLRLAMQGEGWHVIDMPAARDLLRRLLRGESFQAVLIAGPARGGPEGGAGGEVAVAEVARLAAAAPHVPILVAADCENGRHIDRLRAAGARGVLPANTGLRTLLAALGRLRGGALLPAEWAAPGAARPAEPPLPGALTRRQREVLALLSEGKSNRLIAAALAVSEDTVKVHVKQIMRRLKVANRTQAALLATGAARPFAPRTARVGAL